MEKAVVSDMDSRKAIPVRHSDMGTRKAVLFDFDGVIGKTMDDNYQAWKYAFSKYDINIDKDEYFILEGLNTRKVTEHFLSEDLRKSGIIDEVIKLKEEYYSRTHRFVFYDGVESLISRLKAKGYLLGLVSGGSYVRILHSLSSGFLNKFDVVITGDKVGNCKPHPEPYLNAARTLSVRPSDCIVIENAPAGIESAKKAGMYCIAICSTLDRKYLQKADKIIDRFTDLEEILLSNK